MWCHIFTIHIYCLKNLPIKDLCPSADKGSATHVTFALLKPRLMNVLSNALQFENDSVNCQMLLGTPMALHEIPNDYNLFMQVA